MIPNILRFLGSNEIILGICSLLGIISFGLTLMVTFKTTKIAKVLEFNHITETYNKERLGFQKTFEGHRSSIIDENLRNDKVLKTILKNVESYRTKFEGILSFREKKTLNAFINILKKPASEVDFNTVCNYLAILSGRLSKKGDKKNG